MHPFKGMLTRLSAFSTRRPWTHTRPVGGMYDKHQNSLLAPIGKKDMTVSQDLIAAPTPVT